MNDSHKNREEDDDEEGGGVGSGAGNGMTLPFSGGGAAEPSLEDDDEEVSEEDLDAISPEGTNFPLSEADLVGEEVLPNDMVVGRYDGFWYLFYTDGSRYGPFRTQEKALAVAFNIRPWGPSP